MIMGDDPISRDVKRMFGMMSRGPVGTATGGAQSFASLYERLSNALPDEINAITDYRRMANLARKLGAAEAPGEAREKYVVMAIELDSIADQEGLHEKKISEMLRSLGRD
ncbi:MAG: hypothetical protein AAB037_01685 [Chloroflexota bacterium]